MFVGCIQLIYVSGLVQEVFKREHKFNRRRVSRYNIMQQQLNIFKKIKLKI